MSDVYKYSLEVILEHIQVCEKRFSNINSPIDFDSSESGSMILDSIVIRLQAIGENLKRILKHNAQLTKKYSDIEWFKIVQFRDFISHHYEKLDYEIVFDICKSYLPILKNVIETEHKNS